MRLLWPKTVPCRDTFTVWDIPPSRASHDRKVTIDEELKIRLIEPIFYSSDGDDSIYEPSSTDDDFEGEEELFSLEDVIPEDKQDILELLDNALEERELLDLPPPVGGLTEAGEEDLLRAAGLPTSFGKRPPVTGQDEIEQEQDFVSEEDTQVKPKKQKKARCQNHSEVFDSKSVLAKSSVSHTVFSSSSESDTEENSAEVVKKEWTHEQVLKKYWPQRYHLWSRYDEGIWMDTVGWYSVTPELIAKHIATRLPHDQTLTVWDPFGGLGGNAIQFALAGHHVICSDISSERLKMAEHNARVYDVDEWIDFVHGDFFLLSKRIRADVVFLSPPWGGPAYLKAPSFDVGSMMDLDGQLVLDTALICASNIIYFLPKNSSLDSIARLFADLPSTVFEVEENLLNSHPKSLSVYYGPIFHSAV